MRLGIATCRERPDLTEGDRALVARLRDKGAEAVPLIWDQPNSLAAGDGIVIRSTWDYHLNSAAFERWIGEIERSSLRLLNSPEVILWNLDKSYLQDLSRRGLSTVPSLFFSKALPTAEIFERLRSSGWDGIVTKPTVSATSFLTFRTRIGDAELPAMIERIRAHSDVVVQPYIPSVASSGEVSLMFWNGKKPEFSHSVLKRPRSGDFRVQFDFGGTFAPHHPSTELLTFAEAALSTVSGDWAFARVDVINWEEEPLLSELEMIEPDLFLPGQPAAIDRLAEILLEKLGS